MKEAVTQPDLSVKIVDASIPVPGDDEVMIKVIIAAANPIDWKGVLPEDEERLHGNLEAKHYRNSGKDVAGYIHSVGAKVSNFKPGDRVASTNHGSGFAEYAVGPVYTTYHVPENTSFEDAAAFGLPYITGALALYRALNLPAPWAPSASSTPLLIYGASSAVGSFAVKLAQLSNIHPVIAVAGRTSNYVSSLLNAGKGDVVINYRQDRSALLSAIRKAAPKIEHALDAISTPETVALLGNVVDPKRGKIAVVLPLDPAPEIPTGIELPLVFAPGLWALAVELKNPPMQYI